MALIQDVTDSSIDIPIELQGYNYKIVYYVPHELDVDMTIDPLKIGTLKSSILADGRILEPIFVWRDGDGKIHIINGMHRTYCAQQLKEELPNMLIPAVVIDCPEEKFREARVIAASPHIAIRESRINEWIRDAWKSSDFGKAPNVSLFSSAYGVYQKKGQFADKQIQYWFERNSRLWGIHIDALAYIVLGSYRTEKGKKITNEGLLSKSIEFGLSIDQHSTLSQAFPHGIGRKGSLNDERHIDEYIENVVAKLPTNQEPISPEEFWRSKYTQPKPRHDDTKPTIESMDETNQEDRQKANQEETLRRWENIVNGSANFVEFLSKLMPIDYDLLFAHRPRTRHRVTELLGSAAALRRKVYVNQSDISDTIDLLRLENERLKREIDRMEKEQQSGQRISVKPSTMALSSAEIENSNVLTE